MSEGRLKAKLLLSDGYENAPGTPFNSYFVRFYLTCNTENNENDLALLSELPV